MIYWNINNIASCQSKCNHDRKCWKSPLAPTVFSTWYGFLAVTCIWVLIPSWGPSSSCVLEENLWELMEQVFPRWIFMLAPSKKSKRSIAVSDSPHRYGNSHAIWDHTVLPATQHRWNSRRYPSRSWYSIKRPRRDARLSWPSWLVIAGDGIPARRRSPIPVVTGPDVRQLRSLTNSANHYATPPTVLAMRAKNLACYLLSINRSHTCFVVNFCINRC